MARRDTILVSRTLYQIGYMTLVASIVWVGVGIYTATNKGLVADVDKSLLEPINPTLDQEVVRALSDRLKVEIEVVTMPTSSSESASINVVETATEEIIEIPTEIASESATIEEEGALR